MPPPSRPSKSATLVAALLLFTATFTPAEASAQTAVNLSPAAWSDREEVEAAVDLRDYDKAAAEGSHGVIVGTTGPPAVRAGLEALRQGGSAADAVVTTALTQITLAAGSWVSYAGIFNLVYYEAESGEVHNVSGAFNTVLGEDDPATIPRAKYAGGDGTPSGRTALVPGFFAGAQAAHERFGKLPWAALFEPALYYAENGFVLNDHHGSMLEGRKEHLSRLAETRAVFTQEDGTFVGAGDVFRQPALAKTLRAVAEHGADYIYKGAWAERFVAAVRRDGGTMTLKDLHAYEPIWQQPLGTTHAGYQVVGQGFPAFGGALVSEALNVMEAAGLSAMGHYTDSPKAFFWLTQISQLMSTPFIPPAVRPTVFGGLDTSFEARLDKENAKLLWEKMKAGEVTLTKVPRRADPKHSDAIVAIDSYGNVAAVVHTINTVSWGETGIFVDGISIPDAATFQQQQIAETGPGKRIPDGTEPMIVLKDGKPVAALASIGGGLHQKTLSVLVNLLGHGRDIKAAIDLPSHHLPDFPGGGVVTQQVIEGEFSAELLAAVRAMGLEIREVSQAPRGWVVGATIGPNGERRAAATTLLNGPAMAY